MSNPYNWFFYLNPVLTSPKLIQLKNFLQNERQTKDIYPRSENVFQAFELCPFPTTKVVIIGDHPFVGGSERQPEAQGLCFSSPGEKRPPELQIIFNEIYRDLNIQYDFNLSQDEVFPTGELTSWARNGFLLLNTVLTTERGNPAAHSGMGWELIAEAAIVALNKRREPIIFMLWGERAQKYKSLIKGNNIVLEAGHPATEIQGEGSFYACKHFSIVRDILPEIYIEDERIVLDLTSFFKKEKAVRYIREIYPQYADKAEEYIMKYLVVSAWLNPHHRLLYYKEFMNILSTSKNKL